jgi:carbohydrate-selective porin OprB
LGSLQQGKFVEFASYTYNEAEGPALASFGKHTVTAGAAYLRPFDIQGEIGTSIIWFDPHDLVPGESLDDQTGFELYWKILLTPNLWITPGFQYIWNPVFNPTEDEIFLPHIKFRLA